MLNLFIALTGMTTTMARHEELREQAAFCLKSAQTVKDPAYKLALIELAQWWANQADRACLVEDPRAKGSFLRSY